MRIKVMPQRVDLHMHQPHKFVFARLLEAAKSLKKSFDRCRCNAAVLVELLVATLPAHYLR